MTPYQEWVIGIVERIMSSVSLVGTFFIILTFSFFPSFRKPINRLILYASFGNVITNVATIMSIGAMPTYGGSIPLCRFQGFLIQMFMPADSLWTFCMALNIYLTFFWNYDAQSLRNLEWIYGAACYGIPLVPSVIYLALDLSADTGIYGPAVIWCWVSSSHEWMRIFFFYVPVWIVLFAIIVIYSRTGRLILKQRAALQAFANNSDPGPIIDNALTETNYNGVTLVTEIEVTSESIEEPAKCDRSGAGSRSSFTGHWDISDAPVSKATPEQTLTRSPTSRSWKERCAANQTAPVNSQPENEPSTPKTPWVTETDQRRASISAGRPLPVGLLVDLEGQRPVIGAAAARKNSLARLQMNRAVWGYAKVSIWMFLALFFVWVPSSINRFYSFRHPTEPIFALNIIAAAVLPTQGFWNCVIYIATSWSQCKEAYTEVKSECALWHRRRFGGDRTVSWLSRDAQSVFSTNGRRRLGSTSEGGERERPKSKNAAGGARGLVCNESTLSKAVSAANTARSSLRPQSTATSLSTFSISNISPAGFYMPKPRGSRSSVHKDVPSARTPATIQQQLRLKALQTSPTKSRRAGGSGSSSKRSAASVNRRSAASTVSASSSLCGKRVVNIAPHSPSMMSAPMSPRSFHSFATSRSLHAVSEVEGEELRETTNSGRISNGSAATAAAAAMPTGKRQVGNRARTASTTTTASRERERDLPMLSPLSYKRVSSSTLTGVRRTSECA